MPHALAYDCDLKSSNIHGLAYDKQAGLGYVEFNGGRRFAYAMPQKLFDEMRAAKSIGSFFARNVKGKCPVAWVGQCCDNSPCRENASLQGEVAGVKFVVCTPCSKAPRLHAITFYPFPESK